MFLRSFFALIIFCGISGSVFAQVASRNEPDDSEVATPPPFRLGPEIGFYVPANNKASDAFGQFFTNYGLGLGGITDVPRKGQFLIDMNIITNQRPESRVLIAPVGVSYRFSTIEPRAATFYTGASANLVFASFQSQDYNVRRGFATGVGASVLAGFNFTDKAYIQTRYYAISSISGFDLSGLNLSLGYRFWGGNRAKVAPVPVLLNNK